MAKRESKSKAKPKLATALKQAIDAKGLTLMSAAGQAGVSDNTFRSDLKRNTYGEDYLIELAALIGLVDTREELERRFEFSWARSRRSTRRALALRGENGELSLNEALDYVDDKLTRFWRSSKDVPQDVRVLMDAMHQDDLMIFSSLDLPPIEMTPSGLKQLAPSVARAIAGGACCVYLRPGEAVQKRVRRAGYHRMPPEQAFDDEIRVFRTIVEREVERHHTQKKALIRRRLLDFKCRDGLFWLPHTAFVLFQTRTPGGMVRNQLTARLPTGTSGFPREIILPCSSDFTDLYLAFVINALEQSVDKHRETRMVLDLLAGNAAGAE